MSSPAPGMWVAGEAVRTRDTAHARDDPADFAPESAFRARRAQNDTPNDGLSA